ncbi:MAG TPA: LUD domain-containing protein [Pirellulaceae bacterium]|nr:LUD domain-containing protein [Pirellulaceae bacterium]
MSSKADILAAIRQHQIVPTELPTLAQPWIQYPDRQQQFTDVLTQIGGRVVVAPDMAAVQRDLDAHDLFVQAQQICSLVPGISRVNVDLDALDDPHQTETIDFAVLPAEFAVAENGALWVTDAAVKHRVVYFICQHLAFVVPRDQILSNMHQAYERLSFGEPRFGAFISGPSKTADIEQSLVIGAHGPKSTTVYLLG